MKTLFGFIIFLIACLFFTAVIYYPVYQLLSHFFDVRPDRVFYRTAMILAIVTASPFFKYFQLYGKENIGINLPKNAFIAEITKGILIGIFIMSIIINLLIQFGTLEWDLIEINATSLLKTIFIALIAGSLIGFIEEIFFRGALQTGMRRSRSLLISATAISLFYAAVHFIRPPSIPTGQPVDWFTGFQLLSGLGYKYAHFPDFVDSFLALFSAGFFLSLVREFRNNIAISIGVHIGWILIIRLTKLSTDTNSTSDYAWLVGDYDHITGWLALLVISIINLWYWQQMKKKI